jgi:hypothetical protein
MSGLGRNRYLTIQTIEARQLYYGKVFLKKKEPAPIVLLTTCKIVSAEARQILCGENTIFLDADIQPDLAVSKTGMERKSLILVCDVHLVIQWETTQRRTFCAS